MPSTLRRSVRLCACCRKRLARGTPAGATARPLYPAPAERAASRLDCLAHPDQYRQLKDALYRYHRRHLVDIRGTIPLPFGHYYFVFLFGRDRRKRDEPVPFERRATTGRWVRLVGWLIMLAILALLVLGALGFAYLLHIR
jgi:hypothetical protein